MYAVTNAPVNSKQSHEYGQIQVVLKYKQEHASSVCTVYVNGGPEGNSFEGNYMSELLYVFIYHGKFSTYSLVFKQGPFTR